MLDASITLRQAFPYLRLYKGKIFVIKVGGNVLSRRDWSDNLAEDISLLQQLGIRLVLVHGGGKQATELSGRLGLKTNIVAGRRVTDEATLEVAKMVYAGSLNIDLLARLRAHHTPAVGLSGVDAGLVTVRRRPVSLIAPAPGEPPVSVDFGFVGDVVSVDASVLKVLLDGGFLPVIASLASDEAGVIYNVNADSIAEAMARALGAEKFIVLTDADGLLADVKNPASLIPYTDAEEIERLKKSGGLSGGMLPKVEACLRAVRDGVRRTHIINGTKPNALLREVFTNAGCGTMIVERCEREAYQNSELPAPAAGA
ncbi:MAG TPA: acetylglutamate kinase [Elusimicrobia bacterium]|nr:acetylglutamate kinase [Elusimicrobiota bacterium]HBT61100.1 acetylglutamate kinase [Elusimicrobiota bacterium]